jgi:hypothetical protein
VGLRSSLGVREPDAAGDRGDVDDPAVAALEHPRQREAGQLDRRDQVDADHGLDLLRAQRVEAPLELECRVVHEDVDAAELGRGRRRDLRRGAAAAEVDRRDGNLPLLLRSSLASRVSSGSERATSSRFMPRPARARAMYSPMPWETPVTMALRGSTRLSFPEIVLTRDCLIMR